MDPSKIRGFGLQTDLVVQVRAGAQAKTQFSYTILSKRKLAWFVDNGYAAWSNQMAGASDPRGVLPVLLPVQSIFLSRTFMGLVCKP